MKLQLEFIRSRRLPLIGIGVCLCSALLCGWAVVQWRIAYVQQQQGREKLAALQRAIKDREYAARLQKNRIDPAVLQRAREEKKALDTLRYPWNRVLAGVEQADSADVALLSLTHEQSTGVTQLTVEAINAGALIAYVEKLNAGNEEGGDTWYLSSYQALPQNNPPTVKGSVLLFLKSSK